MNRLHPAMRRVDTVAEAVQTAAGLWADRPYLTYAPTGETWTFGQLAERAGRFAAVLRELGLCPGDRVGLFMQNRPEYLLGIFGCALGGFVQVPVNHFYRAGEVRYVLGNSGATAVALEPELLPVLREARADLPDLRHVLVTAARPPGKPGAATPAATSTGGGTFVPDALSLDDALAAAVPGVPAAPKETDLFALIYTSGTTGLPKGVMLTQRGYTLAAKALGALPLDEIETNYTALPLFHINAQCYSSVGMLLGGKRLALSDRFTPRKFWTEIAHTRATLFNALGSMMQILLAAAEQDPPGRHGARYVIVGGTPPELWEKFEQVFSVRVIEGYSQTEDPLPCLNFHDPDRRRVGSFGLPVFPDLGHEVRVVDDSGRDVPPGERGELLRRSPSTMAGYWRDEARTAEALRDGWLRSGDVVRRDADGFLWFVDRKKFIIRRSGENISAWEVEAALKDHPAVKDCAVIPVPDALRGEEVKAIVELTAPHTPTSVPPAELVRHVAARLAYFKVPRYVEYAPLPYTPTGRVRKAELIESERRRAEHGWDRDVEWPSWRAETG